MLIASPKALRLSSPNVASTFTALRATAPWTPSDTGSVHDLFHWFQRFVSKFGYCIFMLEPCTYLGNGH
jgi:hypothetical protein